MNKVQKLTQYLQDNFNDAFAASPALGLEELAKLKVLIAEQDAARVARGDTSTNKPGRDPDTLTLFRHMVEVRSPYRLQFNSNVKGEHLKAVIIATGSDDYIKYCNELPEEGVEIDTNENTHTFIIGNTTEKYTIRVNEGKEITVSADDLTDEMIFQYMTILPDSAMQILEAIKYYGNTKIEFAGEEYKTITIDFDNLDAVYDVFVEGKTPEEA